MYFVETSLKIFLTSVRFFGFQILRELEEVTSNSSSSVSKKTGQNRWEKIGVTPVTCDVYAFSDDHL